MDPLLVVMILSSVCSASSEPLSLALKRRSDFNVYASEFAQEYEPMSFAAIPLHAPVRLLQILSPQPLAEVPPALTAVHERPSILHSSFASPVYATSMTQNMYVKAPSPQYASYFQYEDDYQEVPHHHPPPPTIIYTKPYAGDETSPKVLYASPNKNGGYTYHRKPTKKRIPPMKKPPSRPKPFIIRVHKYRVIRG